MRLLLAVNDNTLEEYIISNYKDIEICAIVRLKKQLVEKVVETKPDLILFSSAMPGEENITDLITKLTSKTFSKLRIAYLYGAEDQDKKNFINFLISRGIFDYYVGSQLSPDVIKSLIYEPKIRENVKDDILTIAAPIVNILDDSKQEKSKIEFIREYIEELDEEQKISLGLIKKDKVIEHRILQDVIFGTITIGIAGSSSGIGSTFISITVAKYINNYDKKLKVAILEMNDSKDFNSINVDYPKAELDDSFTLDGIDYYTSSTSLVELLAINKYQYIIMDMGVLKKRINNKLVLHEHYNEFVRANLSILLVGSMPWQSKDISTCLYSDSNRNDNKDSNNWKLLFNFTTDNKFKQFSNNVDWPCYNIPHCSDPFLPQDEVLNIFNDVLASVMPATKELKTKKMWPFIRR